jgi:hypothetical protein
MSGRIALIIKGLPDIPVEDAIDRFRKYYPDPVSGVFHQSPSFIGRVDQNQIVFTDQQGSTKGGRGINAQIMTDLRKLQSDFNEYTSKNPGIYTNTPTTESRAKLYRRVGFKDIADSPEQVIDRRAISTEDLPYIQALDGILQRAEVNKALGNTRPPEVVNAGDYDFPSLLKNKPTSEDLSDSLRQKELVRTTNEVDQRERAEAARLGMSYDDYFNMRSAEAEQRMRQRMAERMSRARQRTPESFAPEPNPFASTANIPAPSRPSVMDDYDDIPF